MYGKTYSELLEEEDEVELLAQYRFDKFGYETEFETYTGRIGDIEALFVRTMLNLTFYEFLWKVDIFVNIPIVYRG